MNRRFFLLPLVLFYVHSTSVTAADCSEFRSDMQAIQQQVRQIEFGRSSSGLNAVQEASRTIKTACLDQLSALDMTSFGLTPGASAIITKLGNQACQKLSQELSEKINEANQKATQGINSAIGQVSVPGINNSTIKDAIGLPSGTPMASEPTMTNKAVTYVSNAWDSLKNMIMP